MPYETISIEEARNLGNFYMHEFHRTDEFIEADEILKLCGLQQMVNTFDRWFDDKECYIRIVDKKKSGFSLKLN